jgi:protein-S-isoprenylcysteine O-methyltransferase Ste14
MRNPIRLKNLRRRYLLAYAIGVGLLFVVRPSAIEYALGATAVLAGALLRTWGAGHLEKTVSLTITGPYAHLRHPLYLGTLLVGSGVGVMVGGWVALLVLALFLPWFFLDYFPRKEWAESQRLEALYGDAFGAYRSAVPALRPRIRAWTPLPSAAGLGDAARRWSLARYSENNELGTLLGVLAVLVAFGLRTAAVLGSP